MKVFLRFFYLSFLIFFAISKSASAQLSRGIPYIHNYSAAEYGAGTDNWAVIQDKRGVMYFGNFSGVLEYDGSLWRTIPVSNQSLVRSLSIDSSGIIYVGAVGEFGFLSPGIKGDLEYHSLLGKLPDGFREFGDVWKTYSTPEGVFFQTFDYLFFYSKKGIKVFLPSNSFHFSFYVNNRFFITDRGKGLMTIRNDSLVLAYNGDFFSDKRTYAMLPYGKDTFLTATREKGSFLLPAAEGSTIIPFPTQADAYLNQNQVYHGIVLEDGSYALATLRGGVVLIDKSGGLINILNKESRMQNENVKYIFSDQVGGLWMALDDGISRAEIGIPARIFTDISGVKGAISDIIKYHENLYIATSQGIFSFDSKAGEMDFLNPEDVKKLARCFYPVGNISSQGWDLLNTRQGLLLAASTDGVYQISGNKTTPVNKEYSFALCQSKKTHERIFVGTQYGLFSLKFQNGQWIDEGKLKGVDSEIRSVSEDAEGNLFLGMPFVGVARFRFCNTCSNETDTVYKTAWGKKYVIDKFDTASGLPDLVWNTVFESEEGMFVGTFKGLYSFNYEANKFVPETRYGKEFADGSRQVFCFVQEKDDSWIYTANTRSRTLSLIRNGEIINKPFKRFYEHEIHTVYLEDSTHLWLGSANGLINYQLHTKKKFDKPFVSLVRKVVAGKDSVIFSGTNYSEVLWGDTTVRIPSFSQPEATVVSLAYHLNSIAFEFTATCYDNESSNKFRWFLEGNDTEWTEWKKEQKTHYTNLKEGNYKFHLQSQNIYESVGEEAVYEFSILPPWYRTYVAYFFYLLLLVGLIYISIKISVRQLEQAKIRLEKIVAERTAEVVKQKVEIESQNHQLEHKNKEITDSINYARRIQEAILPSSDYLKTCFGEYFVLFMPKDIVSGDFFWSFQTPENKIIWAAVDCTGHGVPGAFMSMIGNSLLNEIVVENKICNSDEILNHLRESIIKSLKQTGEAGKQKDGMDIALCVLDKNTSILQFSGANNPFWLVRKGELVAHKPDKQPIGYYSDQMKPFTKQEIQLTPGDTLYTFTDGYEDQFGGPKKKKFMSKNLKELLVSIQTKTMNEQKEILQRTIVEWMDDEEQIDDICIFGVRV